MWGEAERTLEPEAASFGGESSLPLLVIDTPIGFNRSALGPSCRVTHPSSKSRLQALG
jgi:hypothetical protein